MARPNAPQSLFDWQLIVAKEAEVAERLGAVRAAKLKLRCAYHGVIRQRQEALKNALAAHLKSEIEFEELKNGIGK